MSVNRGFMENTVVSLEKYRHSLLNQGPKSLKTKVYGASTYIQIAAILQNDHNFLITRVERGKNLPPVVNTGILSTNAREILNLSRTFKPNYTVLV